jgi:dolichyl-phosphate beta-glucosyltransferase
MAESDRANGTRQFDSALFWKQHRASRGAQMLSVVIVVPCFNEAQRLSPEDFHAFAQRWPYGRFLFVDDGSTDSTFAVLSELQERIPAQVEVLRLPRNVGKAEAVRQGMLRSFQSSAQYVGFWDADLATPLDAIPLFERVLRDRPAIDIVLGARIKLLGRDIQRSPTRHHLGRIFATFVAVTLGLEVYDSQCGAKLFRSTESVRAVFQNAFLSRWIFDVEILARFMKLKQSDAASALEASLYELPLPRWHDITGSKLRPKDFIRAIYDLAQIHRSMK